MVAHHKVDFFAILEPMSSCINNFKVKIPLRNSTSNDAEMGKIWVLWKDPLKVWVLSCTSQSNNLEVDHNVSLRLVSIIYAKCTIMERISFSF